MRIKDSVNADFVKESSHHRSGALDLKYGGQYGVMMNIGGKGEGVEEWLSAAPYLSRPVKAIVLDTPKFYEFYPNKKELQEMFINLVETGCETITGLKGGITMDTDSFQISAAGDMFETFKKNNRAQSEVEHAYRERSGKPINTFLDFLLRHGVNDPDLQRPLVTTLSTYKSQVEEDEREYSIHMYTSTVLYFEVDFSFLNITEAWIAVNHFPKVSGDFESKYDLTAGAEMLLYSVPWAGIYRNTGKVRAFAKTMLDKLTNLSIDPDEVALFLTKRQPSATGGEYGLNRPIED